MPTPNHPIYSNLSFDPAEIPDLKHNPSFSFTELTETIYEAVAQVAQRTPPFSKTCDGTIRITAIPRCDAANVWLAPDTKRPCLHGIAERCFKIFHEGHYTIRDSDSDRVSTYGYSALKTATCIDLVDNDISLNSLSNLSPDIRFQYTEDRGYSLRYGSLCIKLHYASNSIATRSGELFAEIYVCVSSGNQLDDARCAWEAIRVVQEMCLTEDSPIYVSETPVHPFDKYITACRGIDARIR